MVIGADRISAGWPPAGEVGMAHGAVQPIRDDVVKAPRHCMLEALASMLALLSEQLVDIAPQQRRRMDLHVVVSERWAPLIGLPWHPDLADRHVSAFRHYVEGQFKSAGVTMNEEDAFSITDDKYHQQHVGVCFASDWMSKIEEAASSWGVRLFSVVPLSEVAWQVAKKKAVAPTWRSLAIVDGPFAMMLEADANALGWAPQQALVAGSGQSGHRMLSGAWQRWRIRRQRDEAETLQVMDAATFECRPLDVWSPPPADSGEVPHQLMARVASLARACHLNGCGTERGWSGRRMGGMLIAVAICLLSIWQAHSAWTIWQEQRLAWAAQQAESHPRTRAAQPWSAEEAARANGVNTAIALLNRSPAQAIKGLAAPKGVSVQLLSAAFEPAKDESAEGDAWALTVQANDWRAFQAYVDHLAKQQGLQKVALLSHDVLENEPGRPLRIALRVTWDSQ